MQFSIEKLPNPANASSGAAGDRFVTVEELADDSTYRRRPSSAGGGGLVSRRFVLDGRKRVGFLQSSVDRSWRTTPNGFGAGRVQSAERRRTAT